MWTTYEAHMNKEKKAALMLKYKWIPILEYYGKLFTLKEFVGCCRGMGFIDADGWGYYAFEDIYFSETRVKPSAITQGNINKSFTHVIWFNK